MDPRRASLIVCIVSLREIKGATRNSLVRLARRMLAHAAEEREVWWTHTDRRRRRAEASKRHPYGERSQLSVPSRTMSAVVQQRVF